nr:hypothetical protein [Deinococcus hopiensis]
MRDHHDAHQDRHHQATLQHQIQRAALACQRCSAAQPQAAEHHQHDGLNGDAAQDVPARQTEVVALRRARGNGDFGQVGGEGQQDQAAHRLSPFQPLAENVGGV